MTDGKRDFPRLRACLDDFVSRYGVGADASVGIDGREVYRYQNGLSDRENARPTDGSELYFLWSGSKLITTALALRLVEENRLFLDAPVSDYLPEFASLRVADGESTRDATKPMLVRHLFTMTAGYDYRSRHAEIADMKKRTSGHCPTRVMVGEFAKTPLLFEPGTHFCYGISHDILVAVTEAVTNERMRDYAERVLFAPLGMTETSYGITEKTPIERIAAQYVWREGSDKPILSQKVCNLIFGDEYDSGGAGVISSTDDYQRFASCIANGGLSHSGYRFLKPETVALWRKNTLTGASLADYEEQVMPGCGYGLGVSTMLDHRQYGATDSHFDFSWGGAAGMRVHICPEEKLSFVWMTHLHYFVNPRQYEKDLRNALFEDL